MNSSRWKLAQVYEKNWWEKNKSLVTLDYHEACATEIRIYSKKYNFNLETASILEIGSGQSDTSPALKNVRIDMQLTL